LHRFPLSSLKVDRSFIREITTNPQDAVLTETIITMAHSLQLSVVAEGVETEEQQTYLVRIGCDAAQGYLISRPVPAADLFTLLQPLCDASPDNSDRQV
jgi:EAL domain-containing protein (putative c-di-GMP-specific phosphodiesterase class I)